MSKFWKFVREKDIKEEMVLGRNHHWHYNPELNSAVETNMVKVTVAEGGGHDFHRHPEMNEILYILKGTAEQWIEDEMQMLEVGDSVYIDPDVVHATFNGGKGELEFLAVLAPSAGWEAGTIDMSENLPYSEYRKRE